MEMTLVAKPGIDNLRFLGLDLSASQERSTKAREKEKVSRLPFFNSILYIGHTRNHLSLSVHEWSDLYYRSPKTTKLVCASPVASLLRKWPCDMLPHMISLEQVLIL